MKWHFGMVCSDQGSDMSNCPPFMESIRHLRFFGSDYPCYVIHEVNI